MFIKAAYYLDPIVKYFNIIKNENVCFHLLCVFQVRCPLAAMLFTWTMCYSTLTPTALEWSKLNALNAVSYCMFSVIISKTEISKCFFGFKPTGMTLATRCSSAGSDQPFTWLAVVSTCGQSVSRSVQKTTSEYRHRSLSTMTHYDHGKLNSCYCGSAAQSGLTVYFPRLIKVQPPVDPEQAKTSSVPDMASRPNASSVSELSLSSIPLKSEHSHKTGQTAKSGYYSQKTKRVSLSSRSKSASWSDSQSSRYSQSASSHSSSSSSSRTRSSLSEAK